jgi:hypothetical protein
MYINDVSDANVATATNDTIAYLTGNTNWTLANTGNPSNCDIADFYLDLVNFTDLTNIGNRRKFISSSLAPMNLGANGQTPTGSSPIVFFSGPSSGWLTNKGTGGMTIASGALGVASSNPP